MLRDKDVKERGRTRTKHWSSAHLAQAQTSAWLLQMHLRLSGLGQPEDEEIFRRQVWEHLLDLDLVAALGSEETGM